MIGQCRHEGAVCSLSATNPRHDINMVDPQFIKLSGMLGLHLDLAPLL